MEGEPRPRGPRPAGARRLKDISHLYLSGRASPAASPPRPAMRRLLRLALAGVADAAVCAEVCANLAVQFARLRQRTIVLDLDARLPNAGYRLGLAPGDYLAHLWPELPPRLARSVLGVRVQCGWTGKNEPPVELQHELEASDCVLVRLPETRHGNTAGLDRLLPLLALPAPTTVERAASQSPMFEAWMASAVRAPRPAARVAPVEPDESGGFDAVLSVHDREPESGSEEATRAALGRGAALPVHILLWGGTPQAAAPVWARIPAHPLRCGARQPLSSLEPEHPASRLYESLAQALLAGLGGRGRGGSRV